MGRVAGIQVSGGGVPKGPVSQARVRIGGLEGDRQSNLRLHGGPERAVSIFSLERIEALRAEGHPIEPGTAGENLTLAELDWARVAPGARLIFARGVILEVASFCAPCKNIAGAFLGGDFQRISAKTQPGWSRVYARVLAEGEIAVGEVVVVVWS
jgi:MOSC domain-containing protein YiiM